MSKRKNVRRLSLESVEDRTCPSGLQPDTVFVGQLEVSVQRATATEAGSIRVTGTAAADQISITTSPAGITRVAFTVHQVLEEIVIARFGEAVAGVVAATANPRVVITFKGVEYLSSTALSELIRLVAQRVACPALDPDLDREIDRRLWELDEVETALKQLSA